MSFSLFALIIVLFKVLLINLTPILLGHYTTIFMGIKNGSNNNNNKNSFLTPGDTDKLGTRISIISMETALRNYLAARWGIEYPLDLMQSRFAAKLRRDTLFMLRLIATP